MEDLSDSLVVPEEEESVQAIVPENTQPSQTSTSLLLKKKKLLEKKEAVAAAEGKLWEQSMAVLAQTTDSELNVKQSREGYEKIKNQYLFAVAKAVKDAKIDALENSLNRSLRATQFEKRAERLLKLIEERKQALVLEHSELSQQMETLRKTLEAKLSEKRANEQLNDKLLAEMMEASASPAFGDLDKVVDEEEQVRRQETDLHQKLDEAATELVRNEEETKTVLDEGEEINAEIESLNKELEQLATKEDENPEVVAVCNKTLRDNLEVEMNGKLLIEQEGIKKLETELSIAKRVNASKLAIVGDEDLRRDWDEETEKAKDEKRQVNEALADAQQECGTLRIKQMDLEIEMELTGARQFHVTEMAYIDNDIDKRNEYLDKILAQQEHDKRDQVDVLYKTSKKTVCSNFFFAKINSMCDLLSHHSILKENVTSVIFMRFLQLCNAENAY
ncbi:unnamed protein product [Gongylonema pulchrum]|uniref:GOLGA2L5 domain-containing protein n=1 Tax=Gongylonema pulchrum TaxID=637853 RepID=A0A183E7T2_9BILA|nr:unnamed protein product [Gongylonema pulchrum]